MPAADLCRWAPRGYWSIFDDSSTLRIRAERVFVPAGLPTDAYNLLDGSVGLRWPASRNDKPWGGRAMKGRNLLSCVMGIPMAAESAVTNS
jgi:hypothetical protein